MAESEGKEWGGKVENMLNPVYADGAKINLVLDWAQNSRKLLLTAIIGTRSSKRSEHR